MVLGINFFESVNIVRSFGQQFGITFPLLLDGEVYHQYSQPGGQSPFPLDYIIDRFGRVAYWNNEYNPGRMHEIIDSLSNPTEIENVKNEKLPLGFELRGNYPNPFNSSTQISFSLSGSEYVEVTIYDILGRQVEKVFAGCAGPGPATVVWQPSNRTDLNSGIYFYRLKVGDGAVVEKMLYLK